MSEVTAYSCKLCLHLPLCRYQQSQDDSDIESTYIRIQKLDQYHGQASGIFGCDEHLAGNMPSRGECVFTDLPIQRLQNVLLNNEHQNQTAIK